jgi:hypothetical protein
MENKKTFLRSSLSGDVVAHYWSDRSVRLCADLIYFHTGKHLTSALCDEVFI